MHIFNWYHSNDTGIHYVHDADHNIHGAIPLLFISPCWFLFAPPLNPLYLLGNPPGCDRIRPPWSQVACKLTSPFSTLSPIPPPLQIPRTQVTKRLTMTTLRIRLLLSGQQAPACQASSQPLLSNSRYQTPFIITFASRYPFLNGSRCIAQKICHIYLQIHTFSEKKYHMALGPIRENTLIMYSKYRPSCWRWLYAEISCDDFSKAELCELWILKCSRREYAPLFWPCHTCHYSDLLSFEP